MRQPLPIRPLVQPMTGPLVPAKSPVTGPPPPPPPPPPPAFAETPVSFGAGALLDYGTGITGTGSTQILAFCSFRVPDAVSGSFATVMAFGFAAYLRIKPDFSLDINFGPTLNAELQGVLKPGMRVNVLLRHEAGTISQVVFQINGGAPILRMSTTMGGAVGSQNRLLVGNLANLSKSFVGAMYRVAIWQGGPMPDITDPAVQALFFNSDGSLADPAASLGGAVIDLYGSGMVAGSNAGSGADFAVTGTISEGAPVPAFAASVAAAPVDRFGYGLNATRTAAPVPVQGYFAGPDTAIEVRAVDTGGTEVLGWTALGVQANGVVAGTVTVPAVDRLLHLELRDSAQSATASQPGSWTTALRILMDGQSNSERAFDPTLAPPESGRVLPATCLGADVASGGPIYTTAPADGAVALADELNRQSGLPVMVLQGGVGGQQISALAPPAAYFDAMIAGLSAVGGPIHAIVWNQGESNALGIQSAGAMTAYANDLTALHAGIVAATGQTVAEVPMVLSSLGVTTAMGDDPWAAFKGFQKDVLPTLPNVHFVAPWNDEVLADTYHSYGLAYERRCLREGYKIAALLGYVADPGRFRITSAAAIDATTTELTLSHGPGNDWEIVTVSHLSGTGAIDATLGTVDSFEISGDGGASWIPATPGVEVATDRITLSHAALPMTGRRLRYFYGALPSGIVRDTSAYGWPLDYENDMAVS